MPKKDGKGRGRGSGKAAKGGQKRKKSDKSNKSEKSETRRPLWSGTLAFGLVTLPVELYPTTRASSASLRMVDDDGTPLRRRYFSQTDGELLEREDIVRGYPVGEGEFVLVEDEELEELDPDHSRIIDLESFVPLEGIDPSYLERAYVLVPDPDAAVAYRLLVKSIAEAERAGIATFVMRGKAYIVAIVSRGGTLRALTMRYHDELRTPESVGLPELQTADAGEVAQYETAMKKLSEEGLDPSELSDRASTRLRKLAESKLKKGQDVHKVDESEVEPDDDDQPIVDVMELLKRSLGQSAQA